jgi:Vault protein inter-alpha-trypsin domain
MEDLMSESSWSRFASSSVRVLVAFLSFAVVLGCAAKMRAPLPEKDDAESTSTTRLSAGAPVGSVRRKVVMARSQPAAPPTAFLAQEGFERGERPPGLAPRNTELWVIARDFDQPAAQTDPAPIHTGLQAKRPGSDEEIPLPLTHTDVRAEVAGYVGTVRLTEKYRNPFAEKIEAVYVFPLPTDAAVTEFLMIIGERQIRGIIREREEAERVYAEAKQQGYVASLLTQERPNVYTQSVANIEPGKSIDVTLAYFHTLAYADGAYEFVFPMVVGPRFNPPGSSNGVGAVARGGYGRSGQSTEVQYLRPGERSGHDISLTVDIDAGMAIEAVSSPTHRERASAASLRRRDIEDTTVSPAITASPSMRSARPRSPARRGGACASRRAHPRRDGERGVRGLESPRHLLRGAGDAALRSGRSACRLHERRGMRGGCPQRHLPRLRSGTWRGRTCHGAANAQAARFSGSRRAGGREGGARPARALARTGQRPGRPCRGNRRRLRSCDDFRNPIRYGVVGCRARMNVVSLVVDSLHGRSLLAPKEDRLARRVVARRR